MKGLLEKICASNGVERELRSELCLLLLIPSLLGAVLAAPDPLYPLVVFIPPAGDPLAQLTSLLIIIDLLPVAEVSALSIPGRLLSTGLLAAFGGSASGGFLGLVRHLTIIIVIALFIVKAVIIILIFLVVHVFVFIEAVPAIATRGVLRGHRDVLFSQVPGRFRE
jgi:hypothetical protein